MTIPPEILEAVAAAGGGRLVLVLGAGCSFEPPTGLPLSSELAERSYRRLVDDHVLDADACADPRDLSAVAEAVFGKTGSQQELVERFPPDEFRHVEPNEGYAILAALMRERAIGAVLNLNFDLAPVIALGMIGAGSEVTTIEGPDDYHRLGALNLIYLHRSISRPADELILRTEQLERAWVEQWEQVAVERVLGGTVTVFVGLGTPAAVLVASARRIVALLRERARMFVVDPARREDSAFFAALGLADGLYVQLGWGEFMYELAQRLVMAHREEVEGACATVIRENDWEDEDVSSLCTRLGELGLVGLGALRAQWLIRPQSYAPHPRDPETLRLLAELLIALALIERRSGLQVRFLESGGVELHRESQGSVNLIVCSGGGTRGWAAIVGEVSKRQTALLRRSGRRAHLALVAGIPGGRVDVAPPANIAGELDTDSVLFGGEVLEILSVDELRRQPDLIERLVG